MKPQVIIMRRRRPEGSAPIPEAPPAPVKPAPSWTRLRGQVEGEFRSHGARVFLQDGVVSARDERRVP